MKKALVIVESPTKVKKISSFLGGDYIVKASMGHVRDLPANASEIPTKFKKEKWATLGVNVEDEFSPLYVVSSAKKKVVKELKESFKDVEELIIATDRDREGESIGWHLVDLLKPKTSVKRIVFTEITKPAILEAIKEPRELDQNLVSAQEARRVLDRLYGYTLSPLLWKKIQRGLSAGRVQSVAVRLIVIREFKRIAFVKSVYWDIKASLATKDEGEFECQLVRVDGKRVATGKDFDESNGELKNPDGVVLLTEDTAKKWLDKIKDEPWTVKSIESSQKNRRPYAPFTTSTLQQEANRKLGFPAKLTMRVAQNLYENGLITYMRTDSVHLSNEAISGARNCIEKLYGAEYLSPKVRNFSNKSKSAQEAHEAIRPAGSEMKKAKDLNISGNEYKLYSLIWKRTMASQMAEARLRFQTVTIHADGAEFRATGKRVEFPGFFRAYVEGVDDPEGALDDQEKTLPKLAEGDVLSCKELKEILHETKPPARYTEATLVKTLEAEGIGRPSTYASIISTIQDRGYVRKAGNQLIPSFRAIAVTQLLEQNFDKLVDLGFTAHMERSLDDIALGKEQRLPYLKSFYSGAEGLQETVKVKEEKVDAREACTIKFPNLETNIRVGRYGPYIETEDDEGEKISLSIPDELAPDEVSPEEIASLIQKKKDGPQSIGVHPEHNENIYVLSGPFGPYLQLGEVKEDEKKPKRVSIPKTVNPADLTLQLAIEYFSLPRRLGHHPETNKVVNAGIGRFGPYVVHDKKYKSIPKDENVLSISLDRAVELLAQADTKKSATPIKELGKHPESGDPINVYEGRYGPYVKYKKVNATIPKGTDPLSVSLEEALELIAKKSATKKKKAVKRKKK